MTGKEIRRLLKVGKSYAGRAVVIYVDSGAQATGFAAGKKLGCAVLRNKLKRLMRKVYRLHAAQIKQCQILFIARKSLVGASYSQVEVAMLEVCRKAGVLIADKVD